MLFQQAEVGIVVQGSPSATNSSPPPAAWRLGADPLRDARHLSAGRLAEREVVRDKQSHSALRIDHRAGGRYLGTPVCVQ